MDLKDKIALITGAGRGIGKAITLELAKQGAIVIGVDINQELVDGISDYLQLNNCAGKGMIMNVTDQQSIESALNAVKSEYGVISVLVNNAGITRDDLVLRMKAEEWQSVIDTNLTSVFKVSQACMRDMLKLRWGRIINITSVVGVTGNPGQANYCAAKAGVIAFTKTLAVEIASRGITVNAIAPGYVDTPMTQQLSAEQKQMILQKIPSKQVCLPEDIAYMAGVLASPRAWYITGQTIHVNGGMFMN